MDRLTLHERSYNMSRIRSKNTKPELLVRKWLWHHGYRYRLNVKSVPGKPDIVLRRFRTAIFVNGCFWHGHEVCGKFVIPQKNTDFWTAKIKRNQERDQENYAVLKDAGWNVIIIWECQLKRNTMEDTMKFVEHILNRQLLKLYAIR